MFTALKYSLFKFWLKLLKQFVTYDNIYTNQLKLKFKISKVIMEMFKINETLVYMT